MTDLTQRPAPTVSATPVALAADLQLGVRRGVLTFAGQGADALGELAELWRDYPSVRPWICAASDGMTQWAQAQPFRWSGLHGRPLDVRSWLADPSTRPPAAWLASSAISQPLIFLVQLCRWQTLQQAGMGDALATGGLALLTGHSQGMMPALLIAESPQGEVSLERMLQYLHYMLWQGLHMAQSAGQAATASGEATPMAAISGPNAKLLQGEIDRLNKILPANDRLMLALHNTPTRHVVSAAPVRLLQLQAALQARADQEPKLKRQGKYAGKPTIFVWEWLSVGAPFHSDHMAQGLAAMRRTVAEIEFSLSAKALRVPVLSPNTLLLYNDATDLCEEAMQDQFVRPVQWYATIRRAIEVAQAEIVIDLGPTDGVAKLSRASLRGAGIEVVAAAVPEGQRRLFSPGASAVQPVDYRDFAPKLVQLPGGRIFVDNAYTRWTGQPPVILPGMTPTTVDAGIVAAAANAGFTAELAGGGQVTDAMFRMRCRELEDLLAPGASFTFNALYLDPYLYDLHLKRGQIVQKARRAGVPIAGVTVSAGVPDVAEAVQLLDDLARDGMTLNAFKPGTVAQVEAVLKIAKAAPHHTIAMHIEGGKAGGHHSWEDLDQLLLDTYHLVRAVPNVVLCVGGGIAEEQRGVALLTGQWSLPYGMPAMPVDAIFLGTIAMACQEATATPAVKRALAAAGGTDQWVLAGQVKGGVTSGRSQLEADIHYLDNAASRCGRLLDQVAGDAAAIAARKAEIIAALQGTAKPYFGELTEMTWQAVLQRMVALMAIGTGSPYEDGPWLDVSWRERVLDMLRRGEARLCGVAKAAQTESVCGGLHELDDPQAVLTRFAARWPQAASVRLRPIDARHFASKICARPGKPVPFVPMIDADVRRWYKSDSLWQAQHPRFDADQVLVIPGPEAVAGVHENEPVAALLTRFDAALIAQLRRDGEVAENVSDVRLRRQVRAPQGLAHAATATGDSQTFATGQTGDFAALAAWVASARTGPLAALFGPAQVWHGRQPMAHPLHKLAYKPLAGTWSLHSDPDGTLRKALWQTANCALHLSALGDGVALDLAVPGGAGPEAAHLHWTLAYCGVGSGQPYFELAATQADAAVRSFYHAALFGADCASVALFDVAKATVVVDGGRAQAYAAVTGGGDAIALPFAFSLAWQPIFAALSAPELAGGLLQLVHLDQGVTQGPAWPPIAGESLACTAQITRVEDADAGRRIVAVATLLRANCVVATLQSAFFVRGYFGNTACVVRASEPHVEAIRITASGWTLLNQQEWMPTTPELVDSVAFSLALTTQQDRAGATHFGVTGELRGEDGDLATIDWRGKGRGRLHPVAAALQLLRASGSADVPTAPKTLGQSVDQTPSDMATFADVSSDHNPIHRSHLVARLADLDTPIVHGMWTKARLYAALVQAIGGDASRVTTIRGEFLAIAQLGETLHLEVARTGLRRGALLCQATAAVERAGQRLPVVRLTATVAPPKTAYVFPGQGIQQRGMGMDGYARSSAARQIWDRADFYTRSALGFSILAVVRDNPRELRAQGKVWRHPEGVLHLTQYTQVAMAVLAQAQIAELREAGALCEDAVACGHSVGEYNALAAYVGVLPLEAVVEIVHMRGLAMHTLVPRDAHGVSGYAMGVIRPHQAKLDHAAAELMVAQIRDQTGQFIQIVNYNVRGRQYSVTGHVQALQQLAAQLNARSGSKPAYVEVPGIDVPFHSTVLSDGVAAFREVLDRRLPATMQAEKLVGRYVPNLVPLAFSLQRPFVAAVCEATQSVALTAALADLPSRQAEPDALARLLLVELLAWQFASPVRWIETQELLMLPGEQGGMGVQRIVEIGVGYQPTLANMAHQTLALLGSQAKSVQILNVEADAAVVLQRDADAPEVADAPAVSAVAVAPAAPIVAAPTTAVTHAPQGGGPVPDAPVSTADALKTLLAVQAKVKADQVRDVETIDELFDGVSSRRNQVLLDIGAEFDAGSIDGAHEKPLGALAAELTRRAAAYRCPGRYLRAAQDEACKRAVGRAGLGRKEVAAYLTEHWGFGDGLQAAVFNALVLQGREGDSARGGSLGGLAAATSKSEAHAVLDTAAQSVAQARGLAAGKRGAAAAGGGSAVDAAVVRELEAKLDQALMRSARTLAQALGHRLEADTAAGAAADEDTSADVLQRELGPDYAKLIAPAFVAKKHVAFASTWAFAQRDVAELYHARRRKQLDDNALAAQAGRLAAHGCDTRVAATAQWYAAKAKDDAALDASLRRIAAAQEPTAVAVAWTRPTLAITVGGALDYREQPDPAVTSAVQWASALTLGLSPAVRACNSNAPFVQVLTNAAQCPMQLTGMTALVTGASPGSIALETVRHLLRGGAHVVVTTSTYDRKRLAAYKRLWQRDAAPDAELHVVPFNAASFQDIDALVQWMFAEVTEQAGATVRVLKRAMAPDLVLPFAALKDLGTLEHMGARSEAAVRAMLLGVERMIAAIAMRYRKQGMPARPCHVVLPLSPNHGTFGGDGAYAETKAGLEVLLHKWHSEHHTWGGATTLCGATIGWVRGTGLMDANDPVSARLESQTGVRTFSSGEMGLLIASLCDNAMRDCARAAPLLVDLTGGFAELPNVRAVTEQIRQELERDSSAAREIRQLQVGLAELTGQPAPQRPQVRALPDWPLPVTSQTTARFPKGRLALADQIVVVGLGELGPCGSARTRFELEVDDALSPAGVLELAWMTGMVRWQADGLGGGWIDSASGEPVAEEELASRYGDAVRQRVGIRWTEPATAGFDPERLPVLATVFLDQDFTFPVANEAEAQSFVRSDPGHTRVQLQDDRWLVTRTAGSEIRVPRQVRLDRRVAGQVPLGWNPTRHGIPKDMADNVDRVTLFNLVATVDAFAAAGLSPEELLRHLHPARVGNTQGAGIGGMRSLHRLYLDPVLGNARQGDVLQETLINVVAAYAVQSYVGSYGTMAHPVGACATAAVSIEEAVDKLTLGRVDFVVAGGYDDYGEEGAIGFSDMNATASSDEMTAMGLEPNQMSRANDVRRRGFVEAQGGGTALLTRGDIALALGLPVYGVLAFAGSFGDGIHKSIPAPGMGALASAMGGQSSPLAKALANFGLTTDDVALVYKHDTSTGANDPNENGLHHRIQTALGRTPGNPLWAVSQKTLTGHSKGGAAAWQLAGICQALAAGVVPGNRNLESVDAQMRKYAHVAFTDRSMYSSETLMAGLITSLGFGHVGGLLLVVHPGAFEAAVPADQRAQWQAQVAERLHAQRNRDAEVLMGLRPAYEKRAHRRFGAADGTDAQLEAEAALLLDPAARLGADDLYADEAPA